MNFCEDLEIVARERFELSALKGASFGALFC
jgi:hypothetical protein